MRSSRAKFRRLFRSFNVRPIFGIRRPATVSNISGKPWAKEDLFFLDNTLRHGMAVGEVAGFLGRHPEEVRTKARQLGLTRSPTKHQFVVLLPGVRVVELQPVAGATDDMWLGSVVLSTHGPLPLTGALMALAPPSCPPGSVGRRLRRGSLVVVQAGGQHPEYAAPHGGRVQCRRTPR